MANAQRNLAAVLVVVVLASCSGKGDGVPEPKGHEVAGVVEEVSGSVTAEWKSAAGEGMRTLTQGGPVFADDTIVTGADGV